MEGYKITITQTNGNKVLYRGFEYARSEEHAKQVAEQIKTQLKDEYVQDGEWLAKIEPTSKETRF